MVSVPKRRVWAGDGTQVVEPPTGLQDAGYAPLEQPYNEHHNWIWNSRDQGANTIIHERNWSKRFDPRMSVNEQVVRDFTSKNINHPYGANEFNIGAQPLCAAPGWEYTQNQECVYLGIEGYDGIMAVWNDKDSILGTTFFDLDFNEASEQVEAIVSEGDTFYVMTTGHSSGDVYFYRFSMSPFSSTPVWSTSDTGSFFKTLGRSCLCIAGDWLGYIRTNVGINTGTDFIRLIRKSDAGAFMQGSGNFGAITGFYPGWSMVSDGVSVFLGAYHPTLAGLVKLGGADISNLNVANYPGGLWFAHDIVGTAPGGGTIVGVGDLIHDGELVHICTTNGQIASYDWQGDTWIANVAAQFNVAKAKENAARQEHASMCYDGFNAWVLTEYDGGSNANNAMVTMAPVTGTSIDESGGTFALQPPASPQLMLARPQPSNPANYLTKIAFADDTLFVLPRITSPASSDGNLIKIPYAGGRR